MKRQELQDLVDTINEIWNTKWVLCNKPIYGGYKLTDPKKGTDWRSTRRNPKEMGAYLQGLLDGMLGDVEPSQEDETFLNLEQSSDGVHP